MTISNSSAKPQGASSGPLVTVKIHPPCGSVALNRPGRRNALSRAMLTELRQTLDDLHQEKRVRAVLLTGIGDSFCAGLDLLEMHETRGGEHSEKKWAQEAVLYHDLIETMLRFPKPIIAAVNGPALAAGLTLASACDYVLAAPEAKFGLPEVRRGLVAGLGAPLVAFRVGAGHAARLLLSAEPISAAEAHRIGLVQEIVPHDKLWARGFQLTETFAANAHEAMQLSKKLLNETIGEHLGVLLSAGAAASATARTTEAAAEGLAAFAEKRPANWP